MVAVVVLAPEAVLVVEEPCLGSVAVRSVAVVVPGRELAYRCLGSGTMEVFDWPFWFDYREY